MAKRKSVLKPHNIISDGYCNMYHDCSVVDLLLWIAFSGVEVAMSIQRLPPATCGQFPASFLGIVDQNINSLDDFIFADPQLTFFRDIMKFRDDTIQHTLEDAFKFFNQTYGLDFSLSPPTDQNEYFYQNARLSPFRLADDIDNLVTLNNWIQTVNMLQDP